VIWDYLLVLLGEQRVYYWVTTAFSGKVYNMGGQTFLLTRQISPRYLLRAAKKLELFIYVWHNWCQIWVFFLHMCVQNLTQGPQKIFGVPHACNPLYNNKRDTKDNEKEFDFKFIILATEFSIIDYGVIQNWSIWKGHNAIYQNNIFL